MRLHTEVKCQCLFTSVKLCLVSNLQKNNWNNNWNSELEFGKGLFGCCCFLVVCGRMLVVCGHLLVICAHLFGLQSFVVVACFSNYDPLIMGMLHTI